MKFAHMADCHIGSWRDPKLRDISTHAFIKAVDTCIEEKVDFVLIAGDLFNNSLPSIDKLKSVVIKLKELKDKNIPVYVIPGSHDFSPSGKTMLDVLEHAELFVNVFKGEIEEKRIKLNFTIDKKTGAKITGILGRKGSLEKNDYEKLIKKNLEEEEGFKIFMFHTAITDFKPKDLEKMESSPLDFLPKNFEYYAGGHVHYIFDKYQPFYGRIVFPGPLFPTNFAELEKFGTGGFYIYNDGELEYHPIQVYNTFNININCNEKSPEHVEREILDVVENKEFINTIITIRVEGVLGSGKPSDIDFKKIFKILYDKSAYFVMKNTNKVSSKEFEEVKITNVPVEELEDNLIKEHLDQIKLKDLSPEKEALLIKSLMHVLGAEKEEGEKVQDFEARIKNDVAKVLEKLR